MFCKVHHFADGIKLLHFNKSIAKLNNFVSCGMKNLVQWFYANKISLNVQKTEMVIFNHQREKLDGDIKIKVNRKKLYTSHFVKNLVKLCIKIDKNLNWKHHVNDIAVKLNLSTLTH